MEHAVRKNGPSLIDAGLAAEKNSCNELDLRIVEGISLFELDGHPVLFSEPGQTLFGLNEMAAYIWRGLEEGLPPPVIASELAQAHLSQAVATEFVWDAVRKWLRAGLVTFRNVRLKTSAARGFFTARLDTLRIAVYTSSEEIRQQLGTLFPDQIMSTATAHDVFYVTKFLDLNCIFHNGINIACCAADELVPTFKAYITEKLLLRKLPKVLLHAACVAHDGKLILISGSPGAGKSVLTMHLMQRGFPYYSDDIVTLTEDGLVAGISFAPTIKLDGSDVILNIRPDLKEAAIHVRPDGRRVRYLSPTSSVAPGRYPVGWIIFMDRSSSRPTGLKPLGQLAAMQKLIEGSYATDGRLTSAACHAMQKILGRADLYELSYSDAAEAAALIEARCDGRA